MYKYYNMAFNIKNLLTNNKSNNTVLIFVSIIITIFTIIVTYYLLSGDEEDTDTDTDTDSDTEDPDTSSKKNITMPFITYNETDAYTKTIIPKNDTDELGIQNNSYSGYEIEKYTYENEDIEKILSKNVKFSFSWKNTSGFTNVKKITFKRYVFDETMNKSGPLSDGELSYELSETGYIIDTYSIERPIASSDENMKYFKNFNGSDLVITFDNDKTTKLDNTSDCLIYSTTDDKLSSCVKEDLYNVIGRNYITVKAEYVEDPAYPNDIAEKYLYKGGDGVSIQTEDLDMSLRIINPLSQTFAPGTSGQTSESEYDEIKYTLKIGSSEISRDVELENDPTSGSAYVYFKKGTNYFYTDTTNQLQKNGTSTDKQLFTLIQSNKADDGDGTTYRIIRVGDGTSGYRYATRENSVTIFKTQSEINTETLWNNMNIGFKEQ